AANDRSSSAVISGDGTTVAFLSRATDLVSPISDTNVADDVFLYDVVGQTVSLASHLPLPGGASTTGDGGCGHISIYKDGLWVAFTSASQNLISTQSDANGAGDDVFLYSRGGNSVALVSHVPTPTNQTGNGASLEPRVSASGNYVVFGSYALDLVGGSTDGNGAEDIFLYNRLTGGTPRLVTHASRSPHTAHSTRCS